MTTFLTVVLGLVVFFILAWVSRRLLGVKRLSVSRTVAASLIGLGAGLLVGFYLHRRDVDIDTATLTGVALGILFTMLAVIVFETLLGDRKKVSLGSLGARIDVVRRSAEVTRIFGRHGLGDGIDLVRGRPLEPEEARALGQSIRASFEEAGGVFVKLGQLLATRPDLIPPEMATELESLHSDVAPAPRETIQAELERSLGKPTESVFADFDWSPLGSASIGQVYKARLSDQRAVVVKVRRPGIVENIERDLAVIDDLASVAEARFSQARSFGLSAVVEEFSSQLRRELDYQIEADHIEDVRLALTNTEIAIPTVLGEFTAEDLLVIEYLHGEPVGDLDRPPEQGQQLANDLFEAELQAMLDGSAFHADLHPGNVMLLEDGRLGLVDFGAVGRLDAYERAAIGDILTALELRDPTMLREAALEVGMKGESRDVSGLDRSLSRLMADHLSSARDPSLDILTDFLSIANAHGLRMPASISEMMRALATLEGTLRLLDPDYEIVAAAQRVARREMVESLSPETLGEDLKREVVRLAPVLRRAPHQIDQIAGQLSRGEMTVRVSLFSRDEDIRWLGHIINRALLAFIGAVLGIVSIMLFQTQGGPELTANISLFQLLGYIGLFGGAILIMRVILEVLREP